MIERSMTRDTKEEEEDLDRLYKVGGLTTGQGDAMTDMCDGVLRCDVVQLLFNVPPTHELAQE